MDEEDITLEEVEINYEVYSSDEEYGFQFAVDDNEYDEVLKELKATDSDADIAEEEKLVCPFAEKGCKRSFSRKHNLLKHLKSHELGLDNKVASVCHICGKTIKGVYSLHLKIHESTKQFHCDDCGRSFRQKVALNNHLLIHRGEKPHECGWCFKRFRQKYTMQSHMKRHTNIKEHICDLCGKEFGDRATLQKHTLVHSTNKPHQCATCFMSFRHKSSLSRHNKIHLKVTQCNYCDRSFRYESFLRKHILTAHKSESISYMEQLDEKDDIKEEIQVMEYEEEESDIMSPAVKVETSQFFNKSVKFTITSVNGQAFSS